MEFFQSIFCILQIYCIIDLRIPSYNPCICSIVPANSCFNFSWMSPALLQSAIRYCTSSISFSLNQCFLVFIPLPSFLWSLLVFTWFFTQTRSVRLHCCLIRILSDFEIHIFLTPTSKAPMKRLEVEACSSGSLLCAQIQRGQ